MLFKYLKSKRKLIEDNARLHKEVELLKPSSPEKVIENILQRGISWYDYRELAEAKRVTYYSDAVNVLENNTLKNEINHLLSDLVQHIAKKSTDFQEVRDLRMTINGVELLRERLSSIENPLKPENPDEDLHSSI